MDEAFTTGVQLAEGVIELLEAGKPLTKENLDAAYVARRRASWIEAEGRVAEKARDGFQKGVVTGLLGMALAGLDRRQALARRGAGRTRPTRSARSRRSTRAGSRPTRSRAIRRECEAKGVPLHDALMDRAGWPAVPLDGKLLVTHQDALLVGGKVQAPPGYADHVTFLRPELCKACGAEGLLRDLLGGGDPPGRGGRPRPSTARSASTAARACGAARERIDGTDEVNLQFRAGTGGLHSAEN